MKFFNVKNPWMWLAFMAGTSVIFGFLFKFIGLHWMYVAAFIPWIPIGIFAVVAIVFAFFINPIKMLIEKRKNNKEE